MSSRGDRPLSPDRGVGLEAAFIEEPARADGPLEWAARDMWEVSAASPFGPDDAAAAIEAGTAHLDQGFFPSRWDRATPAERRYLRSIAETGQATPRTAELSIPQNTAGPLRAALIRKGIVYSPEHGRIAFTVPGMSAFIARQPRNDE